MIVGAPSFWPVTVTVWATFQFAGVKTRLVTDVVPSAPFELKTGRVTFASGADARMTIKDIVPPAFVVVPLAAERVKSPGGAPPPPLFIGFTVMVWD